MKNTVFEHEEAALVANAESSRSAHCWCYVYWKISSLQRVRRALWGPRRIPALTTADI